MNESFPERSWLAVCAVSKKIPTGQPIAIHFSQGYESPIGALRVLEDRNPTDRLWCTPLRHLGHSEGFFWGFREKQRTVQHFFAQPGTASHPFYSPGSANTVLTAG